MALTPCTRATDSLANEPSAGFETKYYPGILVLADGDPEGTNSTLD